MKFGAIDRYLLIGGSQLIFNTARFLAGKRRPVMVVTSPRHSLEQVNIDARAMSLNDALQSAGIDCHISRDIEVDEEVHSLISEGTLGLSISSAWIFKQKFIDRFKGRLINLHGHPLPAIRGGSGFSWDIMNNQRYGGCAIHFVDGGIDTGDVLAYLDYYFPAGCRKPIDYYAFAFERNTSFLEEFVRDLEAGRNFQPIKQLNQLSTYWPRLNTPVNGFIDWSWSLAEIVQFICAFDEPYQGASTLVNDRRVHLKDCFSDYAFGTFHPFQSGIVVKKSQGAVHVATKEGILVANDVRDESGRPMRREIRLGDRLHTPGALLDRARSYRPVYTADGLQEFPGTGKESIDSTIQQSDESNVLC